MSDEDAELARTQKVKDRTCTCCTIAYKDRDLLVHHLETQAKNIASQLERLKKAAA